MINNIKKLLLTKLIEYQTEQLKKLEFPPIPSIENKYMYNDKNKVFVKDIKKNIDLNYVENRFVTTETKDDAKDWSNIFGHKVILWMCNLNLPKDEKYRWKIYKSANVVLDAKISTVVGQQPKEDISISENTNSGNISLSELDELSMDEM